MGIISDWNRSGPPILRPPVRPSVCLSDCLCCVCIPLARPFSHPCRLLCRALCADNKSRIPTQNLWICFGRLGQHFCSATRSSSLIIIVVHFPSRTHTHTEFKARSGNVVQLKLLMVAPGLNHIHICINQCECIVAECVHMDVFVCDPKWTVIRPDIIAIIVIIIFILLNNI